MPAGSSGASTGASAARAFNPKELTTTSIKWRTINEYSVVLGAMLDDVNRDYD
jgi:hypothetical protein